MARSPHVSFQLETHVAASVEACFELSLSVDAHTESMRSSGEKIVGGVSSGVMRLGDTVTWQARHFGIPFRMTSRITAHEAPHRFVDEQVRGPFALWRHEHRFEPQGEGTRMIDVVDFSSPVGPIGRLVDHWVLRDYMKKLLHQRNRWLAAELAAGSD